MTEEQEPDLTPIIEGGAEEEFLVLSSKGVKRYTVNMIAQTCDCPGFMYRNNCRHIKEVEKFKGKVTPSDNQALSEIPEEGMYASEFEKLVGAKVYKSLIVQGDIFEERGIVRRL